MTTNNQSPETPPPGKPAPDSRFSPLDPLPSKALFLDLVPALLFPLSLFGAFESEHETATFLNIWTWFTFLWCVVFTFPLVRPVKHKFSRAVLYFFLVPGMVVVNWGAGTFAGCLVAAGYSAFTNSH